MIEAVEIHAPPIDGLTFRRYRGTEEHAEMHRVHQAVAAANSVDEAITLEQFDIAYANHFNCDHERDIVMAEVDGRLVAYTRVFWQDLVDGGRSYENFGFVHPDWRRRGIGIALHRHNEARLREIAAGHPDIEPKWLSSESPDLDVGNIALLRASRYDTVRYYYDMVAEPLEGIVAPPLPAGVELRPVTRNQYRQIWDAQAEAFRDHWGEAEWTEESWREFDADPSNADPSLWRIGWDGDDIAGVVTTVVPVEENARHGRNRVYVSGVSVRRPWRRRGLARALLASSLVAAREAGHTGASLGVDSDSPTGATDLYRSLGFEPVKTFTAWRKPL